MANCQVSVPPVQGLEENVLTVGREFYLVCKGQFAGKDLSGSAQRVLEEGQDTYDLKIFETAFLSPEELQIKATSYRAGTHQIENLKLQWGEQVVELGPIQFEVQTVIEKTDQTVEPYGPIALTMSWPLILWIVLGALLIFVLTFFGFRIRRHVQRKALIEELRQHDSALTPLAEVHQKYRRWRREHPFFYGHSASQEELKKFLNEVEHAYRLFLVRVFKIPALKWGVGLILRDLKKYHRGVYDEFKIDIRRYFLELSKAQEAATLQSQDMIQLTEGLRILAEKITQFQEKRRKS